MRPHRIAMGGASNSTFLSDRTPHFLNENEIQKIAKQQPGVTMTARARPTRTPLAWKRSRGGCAVCRRGGYGQESGAQKNARAAGTGSFARQAKTASTGGRRADAATVGVAACSHPVQLGRGT